MNDIVYFLRDGDNEELRYSLRSVEKNFPHRNVVFYGGKPNGIEPDRYVKCEQTGPTSSWSVRHMIEQACQDDDLTPDFWLFNDDFFIMRPITNFAPRHQGLMIDHIKEVETLHGCATPYTDLMRHQLETLKKFMNPDRALDYTVHMPLLVNRKDALLTMKTFPAEPMFRTLYGNHRQIGGIQVQDCKFGTIREPKDWKTEFLSTSDEAFRSHDIGEYIRSQFPEKSRFENG